MLRLGRTRIAQIRYPMFEIQSSPNYGPNTGGVAENVDDGSDKITSSKGLAANFRQYSFLPEELYIDNVLAPMTTRITWPEHLLQWPFAVQWNESHGRQNIGSGGARSDVSVALSAGADLQYGQVPVVGCATEHHTLHPLQPMIFGAVGAQGGADL